MDDKALRLSAGGEYNVVAYATEAQPTLPMCVYPTHHSQSMAATSFAAPSTAAAPSMEVIDNRCKSFLCGPGPWFMLGVGVCLGSALEYFILRKRGYNIHSRSTRISTMAADRDHRPDDGSDKVGLNNAIHRCAHAPHIAHACLRNQQQQLPCRCGERRRICPHRAVHNELGPQARDQLVMERLSNHPTQQSAMIQTDGNGCINVYPGCQAHA